MSISQSPRKNSTEQNAAALPNDNSAAADACGNTNNNNDLKQSMSSLIDYGMFGKPKKTNEELKKLKNQLHLYRALDNLEYKMQDRRIWRRPQTFSIGHAERRSQFDPAQVSAANALVINSDILESMGNNNKPLSSTASSSAQNNNNKESSSAAIKSFEAGPRGIIKALSHATAAVPSGSPSPVPFAPPGGGINNSSMAMSSSLSSFQQQNNNNNSTKINQGAPTQQQIAEEIKQNETAAEISEVELRKARKQFRDLVARQRAAEEAAMRPMFEAEKEAEIARSQRGNNNSSSSDFHNNNQRKNTTHQNNNNRKVSPSSLSPRATSARNRGDVSQHQEPIFSSARSMRRRGNTNNNNNNDGSNITDEPATTKANEPRIPQPPSSARRPNTSDSSTSSSSLVSRARLLQFNAFKSGGQTGLQNYLHMRQQKKMQRDHQRAMDEERNNPSSSSAAARRRQQNTDEDEEEASIARVRAMSARESRKNAYAVSAHPFLRPETASHLFKSTHQTEKTLEGYENEIKNQQDQIVDSKTLFDNEHRAATAPEGVSGQHRRTRSYSGAAATARPNNRTTTVVIDENNNNSSSRAAHQHNTNTADDPKIETSDPFGFLEEGADNILAGVTKNDSTAKKDYTQTLQEKLLSLAATRAGVSLAAASAPSRVLGTRPPTADAENAHKMTLEQLDKLHKQQQLQKLRNSNSARRSARRGSERAATDSPRIVSAVGNLHGSQASSSSSHFQQQQQHDTNNNNNNNNTQQQRDMDEVREAVMKRQETFRKDLEKKRRGVRKGDFHQEAPLPFGRAGPDERHIPSPRIHPPHSNNARQERNLCRNVHEASRTPGVNAYKLPPQQFTIKSWTKVSSLKGCQNAGLM